MEDNILYPTFNMELESSIPISAAIGLELVKKGFIVLAPDTICFETRRKDKTIEGFDFWQHFNEMCYRILSLFCNCMTTLILLML